MTNHSWLHFEQQLSCFPDLETLRGPARRQHTLSTRPLHACLEELGLTEYPLPVIQLVGSKGKGSVAWMLESIFRAHGWKTGLYQSPHLQTRQERILLNGQYAPTELWAEILQTFTTSFPSLLTQMSRFEIETALALELFVRSDVDVVILEAGLGGKHDATSTISPDIIGMTSIELEHTDILGPRLEDITQHKADVIRSGIPAVIAPLPPLALNLVSQLCQKRDAPMYCVTNSSPLTNHTHDFTLHNVVYSPQGCHFQLSCPLSWEPSLWHIESPMLGHHVPYLCATAAAIAATLFCSLGDSFDPHSLRSLKHLAIPGRLQQVSHTPTIFLDTAHTPDSVSTALQACQQYASQPPHAVLLGINEDKRIADILNIISPQTQHLLLVATPSHRGCSPTQLQQILLQSSPFPPSQLPSIQLFDHWLDGWRTLQHLLEPQHVGLALGSFSLVGGIQQHLDLPPLPHPLPNSTFLHSD